jgi:MFS family permease
MAAAGAPSILLSYDQQAWLFGNGALTVAFSVYALTLLAALLTCGSLSDHLGRRPLTVGSLAVTIVALAVFLHAHGIGDVIVARALQGFATGVATSTMSASIVELAPQRRQALAQTIVSLTTAGGLGIGVVLAGAAIQWTPSPNTVVFGTAVVVAIVVAVALTVLPETVTRRAGAISSLVPRVHLPADTRREFLRLAPGLVAIWMSAGLVLGLGGTLANSALHLSMGLTSALVVATQPLVATLCTIALAPRVPATVLLTTGYAAVAAGVTMEILSFGTGMAALAVAGAVVTGLGYGGAFSGTLRSLLPSVKQRDRAGFFAAFYIVGYGAYGASALCAGWMSDLVGLRTAGIGYGVATVLAALLALSTYALSARRRHPASTPTRRGEPRHEHLHSLTPARNATTTSEHSSCRTETR